ncbi:MAG: hypothetical protein HPY75_09970 [Actinobacteria bacterium]|nr:hypothetical protein [Actinomycetota bacterium]
MSDFYYAGFDVGTGGCKGILASAHGDMVASAFHPYPLSYPRPGWAEQDPEDWWKAACAGMRRMLEQSGVDPARVKGVGFAGQMLGVVPVDDSGAPLRPAIIWLDNRAENQAASIIRRFGGRRAITLLAGAAPSGKDVVCKLAWLREKEQGLYERTRYFLDATGYLVGRATGRFVMDHTGGGGTGILKPHNREWSRLFAKLLGQDLYRLPPLRSSIEVIGGLRESAAEEMGLSPGAPVIAGMADIPAAATGSGALRDGDAHINIGTSSWLCLSVRKKPGLGKYGIASVVSPDPEMFLVIGESETAGACLEWFAGKMAVALPRSADDVEAELFKRLDAVAAEVEPGAGRLLFAPWMFGERSPVPDTLVRAAFVNLGLGHTWEHMLRAVYEGVAFNLRWLLDAVASAGYPCDPLRAIGGGATSDVWMQVVADVTGRSVEAVEHAREAGAMGCALAVAVATGAIPSFKDIRKAVRVRRVFEPDPGSRRTYDKLYGVFRGLYSRLAGPCHSLNSGLSCAMDPGRKSRLAAGAPGAT